MRFGQAQTLSSEENVFLFGNSEENAFLLGFWEAILPKMRFGQAASFVLALNKAHVLALNTAHVLRLNNKICPVFGANSKEKENTKECQVCSRIKAEA